MPAWLDKLKETIKAHPAVAGGAALGSGVVIFFVIKNHQKAAAASSNTPAAESTPTGTDMAAMHALNGFDIAGMAGLPYGYVSQNGPVDNYPNTGVTPTPAPSPAPAPSPTPTPAPSPAPAPAPSPGPSSGGSHGYWGLLGPNVEVDFKNFKYKNPQGQEVPIPLPSGSYKLTQGSQNRVWYILNADSGTEHLLTSGVGPASEKESYPVGAPFQPASGNSQTNSQVQVTSNSTGMGGGGFAQPVNAGRNTADTLHELLNPWG